MIGAGDNSNNGRRFQPADFATSYRKCRYSARRDAPGILVGITAFVSMAQTFLSAAVRDFRHAFPDLMGEILASDARLYLLVG